MRSRGVTRTRSGGMTRSCARASRVDLLDPRVEDILSSVEYTLI